VVRKAFNISSNAYLEVQWYLFAASFLLAAGYTLLQGEHVKVDVISSRCPSARRSGSTFRLHRLSSRPCALAVLWYGIPFFLRGYVSGEMSSNAGGLIRWPVYLMMPLGFGLLCCKAV
jgi:TRAP-type mannitol/chloroaromatic compound transport system permease small subunit